MIEDSQYIRILYDNCLKYIRFSKPDKSFKKFFIPTPKSSSNPSAMETTCFCRVTGFKARYRLTDRDFFCFSQKDIDALSRIDKQYLIYGSDSFRYADAKYYINLENKLKILPSPSGKTSPYIGIFDRENQTYELVKIQPTFGEAVDTVYENVKWYVMAPFMGVIVVVAMLFGPM